ncbi:AMP-binding protein [Streptomyces cucumeris]|uniref:AMP-binding protein n=1 Tax=Streptomyces TaxID=1883 RepID=UPI0020C9000C|nr:AMP-binding protein [Streptomyces sp. NEAU-Y11]MCP9208579.1 AMP-binding protein [Streptomyces sp. NEAU-Y11]
MPLTSRTEVLPTPAADPRQAARVALRWISEPDCTEELTHADLLDQAARAAAALTRLGVRAGDRVAVHLPLVPESVIATLACGRLDVVRVSLPVGLRPHELRDRIREVGARVVITADGEQRCGEPKPLKQIVDRALTGCPEVRSVLVVHRLSRPVSWKVGRDRWWHEELGRYTEPLPRPYS